MAFKFEKLKVWEKAVDVSAEISVLVKAFPKDELYVSTSQNKQATDSISLHSAEGNTSIKKFIKIKQSILLTIDYRLLTSNYE